MKILDVINPGELEGVKKIKCSILLKSSWMHSEFSGVVVSGEHTEDGSAKIMTVEQMKTLCKGDPEIGFFNARNPEDRIFKFVSNEVGFSINMNSDTHSEVISSNSESVNNTTHTWNLKIDEEYSKGFRISEDNKVVSKDSYSDYELIAGLYNLVAEVTNMKDVYDTDNFREKATLLLLRNVIGDCKPMGMF